MDRRTDINTDRQTERQKKNNIWTDRQTEQQRTMDRQAQR